MSDAVFTPPARVNPLRVFLNVAEENNVHPLVRAYLKKHGDAQSLVTPEGLNTRLVGVSAQRWMQASKLCHLVDQEGMDPEPLLGILSEILGEGIGYDFFLTYAPRMVMH